MVDTEHEVLNAEKRMAAKRDKGFAVSARYDHCGLLVLLSR